MSDSPGWTPPGPPTPDDRGPREGHGPEGAGSGESGPDAAGRPPGGQSPGPAPSADQPAAQPPRSWEAAPPPAEPRSWGERPGGGWGDQRPGGWGAGGSGGWGSGGWGTGGWGQRARAPKPGVIPLRPLGVGEILDGAVSTARAHWRPVLAISLGIAVVIQLIATVATRLWINDSGSLAALEDNPEPTAAELRDALNDLLAYTSVAGLVILLGSVLATAMLTIVVSRAILGHDVTVAEAWQDSRHRLLHLLGLVLLVPLLAVAALFAPLLLTAPTNSFPLVSLGVLGGIAFAVWMWVQLSLAAPALMLERQGVLAAMRRSWKLVRGSWWRIFGIQLLILVLVTVVSGIIEFPTSVIAGLLTGEGAGTALDAAGGNDSWAYLAVSGVGAVLAATITLPLSAGVTALLYVDQRVRREALDLELARAAGLDHPTSGS